MTELRLMGGYLRTVYYWPFFWVLLGLALMLLAPLMLQGTSESTVGRLLQLMMGGAALVIIIMSIGALSARHRRSRRLTLYLHRHQGIKPELWEMYADTLSARRLLLQAARSAGHEAAYWAYCATRQQRSSSGTVK